MPTEITKKNHIRVINDDLETDTMIFAHGFGTDQTAWDKIIGAFQDDKRLILYDNVGAGKSDPDAFSPNRYDTLHSYASDLLDICGKFSVKNAVFVGHSVSGMIGALAAIKEPKYFSKMVLIGASPRYRDDEGYIGGFSQQDLDGLYEAMSNNYFAWVSGFAPAAMGNLDRPELAENFANSLMNIRPDIAQSVARVIFQSDHRIALPQLTQPTLLLQTKEDIAVPMAVAEYLNRHIKNSRLEIVDAKGHFPHISAPEAIIAAIKKFI